MGCPLASPDDPRMISAPNQPSDWRFQNARFLSAKKGLGWIVMTAMRSLIGFSPPFEAFASLMSFSRFLLHSGRNLPRSEEHTSELQSLMRNSYAVFCLKKKRTYIQTTKYTAQS